jgi:hypothetical protein
MAKRTSRPRAKPKTTMMAEQGPTTAPAAEDRRAFACLVCGCDRSGYVGELPTTEYAGVSDDGREYTAIMRERVACEDCGQIAVTKTYVWKD